MINMLASVIITLAMIAVPFVITYIFNHYSDEHDQKPVAAFGDKGLLVLVSCCILLWFVPWGVILLLPIALLVSAVSPAGRQSWQKFSKIRSTSIACMMIVLLIGGFLPVSNPIFGSKNKVFEKRSVDKHFVCQSYKFRPLTDKTSVRHI